ncbi:hypothetical protein GCM10020331_025410 [Ectobacillus funiculus]
MMMKILVIDDDKSVRYMLKEICDFCRVGSNSLQQWNRRCRTICKKMRLMLFSWIFHMPEMDGLMTVHEIRKLSSEVPILVFNSR